MILQTLINPYQHAWIYFRNQSQIVSLLQQNIDVCLINIKLHQAIIDQTSKKLNKVTRFSHIKMRQYQPRPNYARDYYKIEESRKLIASNESEIETHTIELQKAENNYFCSVIEVTALLAATIFGLGAVGGLLITGACVSGVLLVGLATAISILAREVFLFARNTRQLSSLSTEASDLVDIVQLIGDAWTRDLLSQALIRPIAENIIQSILISDD